MVAEGDIDGNLILGALAEAGIPTHSLSANLAPGAWLTGGRNPNDPLRIFVPADRVDEARAVLDEASTGDDSAYEDEGFGFDDEEPDTEYLAPEDVPVLAQGGGSRRIVLWLIAVIVLAALIMGLVSELRTYVG